MLRRFYEMDLGLNGKVAVVCGGASNIGRATSITLAKEGAKVCIADIDKKQAEKTADKIKSFGGDPLVITTDVIKYKNVVEMVESVKRVFGDIDILINCVGTDRLHYFLDTTEDFWQWIIDINYRTVLNTLKVVLPGMVEKRRGCVVNLSSDAARIGEFKEGVYAGCKAAVTALSKTVAREVGRYQIRINVGCPSLTIPADPEEMGEHSLWYKGEYTPEMKEKAVKLYPLRRLCTAQDIANAIVFLSSDLVAGDITGQILSVNGGYAMVD
jgi:NAD(P)-dependent dehydrogenase (short-subunit alcohol dehydrogenase family)